MNARIDLDLTTTLVRPHSITGGEKDSMQRMRCNIEKMASCKQLEQIARKCTVDHNDRAARDGDAQLSIGHEKKDRNAGI